MIKKIILLSALAICGISNAQISLDEGFEGNSNPWANSEMQGPVFVSSEQYFCEGNKAAGAIVSSLLGQVGKGPKFMTSPEALFGNNLNKTEMSFSLILGQLNMTDFTTLEAIPATVDWGYLKIHISTDNGTTWKEFKEINKTNYTSSVSCKTMSFTIPHEEMGTGDNGFMLKFEAAQKSTYAGILIFVIDKLQLNQDILGTNDISKSNISIYPNPAGDYFKISGDKVKVEEVDVYTMDGRLVKSIKANQNQFDIRSLKPSAYIIKTKENKSFNSYKLIKK